MVTTTFCETQHLALTGNREPQTGTKPVACKMAGDGPAELTELLRQKACLALKVLQENILNLYCERKHS